MNWRTYAICGFCVLIGIAGLVGLREAGKIAGDATAAVQDALSGPDLAQTQRSVNVCVAGLVNFRSCNSEQSSTMTADLPRSEDPGLLWILLLAVTLCAISFPAVVFLNWLLSGSGLRY